MPKSLETGKKGEQQAITCLKTAGYTILEVNWRFKKLEIDIIARDGDFLAFIEVKTRKNADFGAPELFVTKAQQKRIIRAAHQYILENPVELETRFDIVSVNNETGNTEVLKRAFYPGL